MKFNILIACAILGTLTLINATTGFAQKTTSTIKIGTYDSRVVTFAWSRSDYFAARMKLIGQQTDSAQKAHDTARIKELSVGSMSYQHLLHLMVFSNGSAAWIMSLVKDKLPELAKTEGVSVILSKWELPYSDPSFEIVDLTARVAGLLNPKENIDKMAAEIGKVNPVPIEEFTIENDMLDLYCRRFGKK
ncbi:MAG: hypothetical protein WCK34_02385 [Bacteroidota bacterium]